MSRSNRYARTVAILAAWALVTSGCMGIQPDARQILQEPASCAEARKHIPTLEANRTDGFTRFTHVLQGIMPPAVVISLVRDVYGKPFRSIYLDHWRVGFGSYNEKIDTRLEQLRACG